MIRTFEKIYNEALDNVTVNPEQLKKELDTRTSSLPPNTKNVLGAVGKALNTENPIDQLLQAVQKDPSIIQKLTPQQKEALNKILNPEENKTDTTQQNKGQTSGQNPTLDQVQKQQSPSNPATKPLI